jgi:Na+/melibiose symporter-like transporter
VADRTQRRWERRGSWVVAGLVALALLVAAFWLLLPLRLA